MTEMVTSGEISKEIVVPVPHFQTLIYTKEMSVPAPLAATLKVAFAELEEGNRKGNGS